ncbi:MAG: hypothetical protein HRT51_05340 [Colwellia sp.]|nr:hypothetical protein [Colwellia sp.]
MQEVQHLPKRLWQKITAIMAKVSFACTAIGIVLTLIYSGDVNEANKASMGAITFISFAIGVVLHAIGSTSIPSLKPDQD